MKVLVTGGSTRIMIDKVRCIGNIFKGHTSINIADAFSADGCDVTLIGTSEMYRNMPNNCCNKFHKYYTYDDLYKAMKDEIENGDYDVIIHSAAVSDYQVADVLDIHMNSVRAGKVSSSLSTMYLELIPTEKIVDRIREWGFAGKLVKFKLQVDMSNEDLLEISRKSREASDADLIVANCLEWAKESAFIIGRDDVEQKVDREGLAKTLLAVIKGEK